ncbi:MAG: hypothetical protein HY893_01340, partial [Deltaproteobacteria bacterium]|nr:hypothetical protein [Deltaproteobacteria bacterium]
MKKTVFLILLFLLALSAPSIAEDGVDSLISPGDLAKSHAKYEGLKNCTQCHSLGKGVPDSKCLDCHDKLAARIRNKEGVHSRYTDKCVKCHGDHKGRRYKMITIDKEKFDHNRTEYELKDKHATTPCDKCHKKEGIWSGLKKECLSCHDDEHKKQLDADCFRCHTFKGWKDVQKFDHKKGSSYDLTGRHRDVKCEKCHQNGKYKPLSFKFCLDCHRDPHKKQFKDKACEACHITKDWKETFFDHNSPEYKGYRLEGKHRAVACDKCHVDKRYKPLDHKECLDCHKDPHKKQFKDKTCESCHTVAGWKKTSFDHNAPDYKGYRLEGKHRDTPCEKCHTQGRFKGIESKKCLDCHKDEHKGQFKDKTCESCHTVAGWKKTSFDHNSPQYKGYRLEGKHKGAPCAKCHLNGVYKPLKYKACLDCHKDKHNGQFKEKVCETCHVTNGWKSLIFDHNAPQYSSYRLDGKHTKTLCDKCHVNGKYKPLPAACLNCHEKDDTHKNELGGVCKKCHTTETWKKATLQHNLQTRFPLIGRHKDTPCDKCHQNKKYKTKAERCVDCHKDVHKGRFKEECGSCHTQSNWQPRKYDHAKRTGFELAGAHNDILCANCHKVKDDYKRVYRLCNQCHVDPHLNQFGGSDCSKCHNQSSWNPMKFSHSSTGFPVMGSHRATDCLDCHKNRAYRNTPTICYNCHLTTFTAAPSHVSKGFSQDCTQCHDSTSLSWTFKHKPVSSGCSSCHMAERPTSHVNDPSSHPTTCETCHTSTSSWTTGKHTTATTGCSSCHMNTRPVSHVNDTVRYPTTCENCHKYPTWTFTHVAASSGCSSCHLNQRPSSHSSDPTRYPTVCESCHKSTSTWTSHTHPVATTGCSSCHLTYSTPARPADHTTNNWTVCESCHKSTSTWTYTHVSVTTGCSTCHMTSSYPAKPAN